MTHFTINSRHGVQRFTVNGDDGYVRINGDQVCEGGSEYGVTLRCSEANLEAVARKWWAARQRRALATA
jgi:hypothetical protein